MSAGAIEEDEESMAAGGAWRINQSSKFRVAMSFRKAVMEGERTGASSKCQKERVMVEIGLSGFHG